MSRPNRDASSSGVLLSGTCKERNGQAFKLVPPNTRAPACCARTPHAQSKHCTWFHRQWMQQSAGGASRPPPVGSKSDTHDVCLCSASQPPQQRTSGMGAFKSPALSTNSVSASRSPRRVAANARVCMCPLSTGTWRKAQNPPSASARAGDAHSTMDVCDLGVCPRGVSTSHHKQSPRQQSVHTRGFPNPPCPSTSTKTRRS